MTKKLLLVALTCLFLFAFAGSALAVDTCDNNCCGFTYTPGYWKNHPEAWPTDEVLAPYGNTFTGSSQDEWLDILNTPPKKGDARLIFAHAWIAACLNYLNDSYTGPDGTITYFNDKDGYAAEALQALLENNNRDLLIQAAAFLDGYNNSNEPE